MVSIQASVSKGWLHQEGGFTFDAPYYLDPLYRWEQDRAIDQFLQERFPHHALYNMESNLVQAAHFAPHQILVGGIQPNLIIAACLGTEFIFPPDKDADVDTKPLAEIDSVDQLPRPADLLEHPLILKFYKQIVTLKRERPDLQVIPPFFWDSSGRATIHGIITTSVKFCGVTIFKRLRKDPDFITAFHQWITNVYIELVQHYSKLADLPISSVHIGECSGTMISPTHYQQFIVPFASQIGQTLGPVRLHSCGCSDKWLDSIAQIDNLRSLDTGSDTSVAAVRECFGPHFPIDLAPPVKLLLAHVHQEQVISWLDKVLAENDNGPLMIGYHLEVGYSLENCLAIHDHLVERELIQQGR